MSSNPATSEPAPGMDHGHYPWSPLPRRATLQWPSRKPVALSVIVLLEHMELYPPSDTVQAPLSGGVMGSQFPFPNMPLLTQREYGMRVGVFRILEMLSRLGIPVTAALDAMTAERYPYIVQRCRNLDAEIVAHGISASRIVSSRMSEAVERDYIAESLSRLKKQTATVISGWLGPEQSQSARTPSLLDEAGLDYCLDWPNDEQPYLMNTPRQLVAVPPAFALDDAYLMLARATTPDDYAKLIVRAFERLAIDGARSARNLTLFIRPWLTGQPFRVDALESALSSIVKSDRAWLGTAGAVAKAFRAQAGQDSATT